MNILEIEICNKKYKISCQEGEEEHILELSTKVNNRINNLQEKFGNKADDRLLFVINSIVMEDELHNLKKNKVTDNSSRKIIEESILKIDRIIQALEE